MSGADQLAPTAETGLDITEHPQYWFKLAEEDQRNNPTLVAEYLRMAELMEKYIELKLGKTWVTL